MLAPLREPWPPLTDGFFMNVGGFLQVTGTGKAQGAVKSETQARALARDAALLDAWRRLRGHLESLRAKDGRPVALRATREPQYNQRLEALVHGAAIVSTHFDDEGTAVIVLRVERRVIQQTLETDYK